MKVEENRNVFTRKAGLLHFLQRLMIRFVTEQFFEGAGSARSTYMERMLSRPDVDIGLVDKKNLVVSLPQTVSH